MIDIHIKVDQDKVLDSFKKDNLTIDEAGIALFRLEQIKKILLDIEFENDIMVTKDENEEDEDGTI